MQVRDDIANPIAGVIGIDDIRHSCVAQAVHAAGLPFLQVSPFDSSYIIALMTHAQLHVHAALAAAVRRIHPVYRPFAPRECSKYLLYQQPCALLLPHHFIRRYHALTRNCAEQSQSPVGHCFCELL